MKRVTFKDIGKKAGVSISTVSLALRNDPRLPKETIERVKKFAEELGYAPDPWLSSLSSYRRVDEQSSRNATIAVLTNWDTKDAWKKNPTIANYWAGAQRMSEKLGYKLEEFWMSEHGGEARTASILYNRGIKGILLMPLPPEVHEMEFDFSKFSVVQVGRTLHWPIVNTVTHNHYEAMQLTVYFLRTMGYRRIGLAVSEKENKLHRCRWLASYLAKQFEFPRSMAKLPVFIPDQMDRESFLGWLVDNQPDVVISNELAPYQFMLDAGMKVPDEVGYSCLCLEGAGEVSGIQMKSEIAGAQAISLLHMEMMNRQHGCPEDPMTQVIEGTWREGNSVKVNNRNVRALT